MMPRRIGEMFIGDGKKTGVTTGISNNLTSWLSSTGHNPGSKRWRQQNAE
ncbi:hypothetical protein QT333_03375 [Escherichia coli]|nr:hypothetical protein [Escherichia coli]